MLVTIRRALLSVSDKTGVVDFARALRAIPASELSLAQAVQAGAPPASVHAVKSRIARWRGSRITGRRYGTPAGYGERRIGGGATPGHAGECRYGRGPWVARAG